MSRPQSMTLDFCDQPLISADGLLMRCCLQNRTYVPLKIIDLVDLVNSLKKQTEEIISCTARRKSSSAPCTPTKVNNNWRLTSNETLQYVTGAKEFIESRTVVRRSKNINCPQSRRKISLSSSSSESSLPNSILLKCSSRTSCSEESLPELFDSCLEDQAESLMSKFKGQIEWVRDKGNDFVAMETLTSILEVTALFRAILDIKIPIAIGVKVGKDTRITVSYQFVDDFKQEYMMLRLNSDYCFFMPPF